MNKLGLARAAGDSVALAAASPVGPAVGAYWEKSDLNGNNGWPAAAG